MWENKLSGTISPNVGRLANMRELYLFNNRLTGTIPPSFGNMTSVTIFSLFVNSLTGTIPSSLGMLTDVVYFGLSTNCLTGTVPSSLGRLVVASFFLFSNSLTGTIPSQLGLATASQGLYCEVNLLTGSIPSQLSGMVSMVQLNLSSNMLSGNIAQLFPLGSMDSLNLLDLSQNQLSGTLPSSLFARSQLQFVILFENCFSGSLHPAICNATSLVVLQLDMLSSASHCLQRVPPAMLSFVHGTFASHLLHGSIPSCVWSMPTLGALHVMGNGLTGTLGEIPSDSVMTTLDVANNRLGGSIPLSIQTHGTFQQLALSVNKLTGTLTSSFFQLNNLTSTLELGINRLSGDIPNSFYQTAPVSLDVLQGNLFDCPTFREGRTPSQDVNANHYVCGSDDLDLSLYQWAIGFFVLTVGYGIHSHLQSRHGGEKGREVMRSVEMMASTMRSRSQVNIDVDGTGSTDTAAHGEGRKTFLTIVLGAVEDAVPVAVTSETLQLNGVMYDLRSCVLGICLCFGLTLLVIFPVMKSVPITSASFSTRTIQYTWVTTAAFMHGAGATALVLLCVFLSQLFMALKLCDPKAPIDHASATPTSSRLHFVPRWKEYLLLTKRAAVVLVNVVVIIAVNAGYVAAILDESINVNDLVLVQIAMGLYKVLWRSVAIPWSIGHMRPLSPQALAHHQTYLNLLLFIVGPSVATLLSDSNCLENIFTAEAPLSDFFVQYFVEVNQVALYTFVNGTWEYDGLSDYPYLSSYTFGNSLTPTWLYSHQCGSSILRNYVPVLFFFYSFSGTLSPCVSLIAAFIPSTAIKNDRLKALHEHVLLSSCNALNVILGLEVDVAVLLTFGLAAPLLTIAIALKALSTTVARGAALIRYRTDLKRSASDVLLTMTVEERLRALYGLDGCVWISIVVADVFWAGMVFDMVSDVYGDYIGRIVAMITATCLPPVTYLLVHGSCGYRGYGGFRGLLTGAPRAPLSPVTPPDPRRMSFISETSNWMWRGPSVANFNAEMKVANEENAEVNIDAKRGDQGNNDFGIVEGNL